MAPKPHKRGARSLAPLPVGETGGDLKGGSAPLFVQGTGGAAADLIIPAQVTPPRGRLRQVDYQSYLSLGRRALDAGAVMLRPRVFRWNTSPWCDDPFTTVVSGHERTGIRRAGFSLDRIAGGWIEVLTACRRCAGCARHRRALWGARARSEIAAAVRTWFGTLTLHPHYQAMTRMQARKDRGASWSRLSEMDKILAQHDVISKEITRYLKRVRKNSGCEIRYLLVMELHKSGLPHYHILIHEPSAARGVSWRQLSEPWSWGFSQFKLVDGPQGANYIAKYLSKSLRARVRASIRYGCDLSS